MLDGLALDPLTPTRLGLTAAPPETGDTHLAIASAKARDWSRAGAMLAVASDGGLRIPALGTGWDSRYTHRFAGPDAGDAQRLERLLELMRPFRGEDRLATWVEALAVADNGRLLVSWELQGATGVIANHASAPLRTSGFWAFSVWLFPKFDKTYDQLSPEELEATGDHWVRLRRLVQGFFHLHLGSSK